MAAAVELLRAGGSGAHICSEVECSSSEDKMNQDALIASKL